MRHTAPGVIRTRLLTNCVSYITHPGAAPLLQQQEEQLWRLASAAKQVLAEVGYSGCAPADGQELIEAVNKQR